MFWRETVHGDEGHHPVNTHQPIRRYCTRWSN